MARMERDEVMKLVRDHLSTELEVAARRSSRETRFRRISMPTPSTSTSL